MNSTTPAQAVDLTNDTWGEKLMLALMIRCPLYVGLIIIMLAYTIIRHQQRRNGTDNEIQQNVQYVRTSDSDAIHYWNYMHLGVL